MRAPRAGWRGHPSGGSGHCPLRFTSKSNFAATLKRITPKVPQNIFVYTKLTVLLLELALFSQQSLTPDLLQSRDQDPGITKGVSKSLPCTAFLHDPELCS